MEHPTLEQLEAYLKAPDNNHELKQHIENCEHCQDMLEGLRMVNSLAQKESITVDHLIERSSSNSLEKIKSHRAAQQEAVSRSRTFQWWWGAAAVLLLIGLFTFLLPGGQPSLEEIMRTEWAETYAAPVQVRSSETMDQAWVNFRDLYIRQDFANALAQINTIPDSLMDAEKQFYKSLALVYMAEPDYNNAIENFEQLASGKSRFAERARWFQALCMLQINDHDRAIPVLNQLVEKGGYKSTEARSLLDLLP